MTLCVPITTRQAEKLLVDNFSGGDVIDDGGKFNVPCDEKYDYHIKFKNDTYKVKHSVKNHESSGFFRRIINVIKCFFASIPKTNCAKIEEVLNRQYVKNMLEEAPIRDRYGIPACQLEFENFASDLRDKLRVENARANATEQGRKDMAEWSYAIHKP